MLIEYDKYKKAQTCENIYASEDLRNDLEKRHYSARKSLKFRLSGIEVRQRYRGP